MQSGRLDKAFYVSVYTNYQPLNDLISRPISETAEAFKAFAGFYLSIFIVVGFITTIYHFNILYTFLRWTGYDFRL